MCDRVFRLKGDVLFSYVFFYVNVFFELFLQEIIEFLVIKINIIIFELEVIFYIYVELDVNFKFFLFCIEVNIKNSDVFDRL